MVLLPSMLRPIVTAMSGATGKTKKTTERILFNSKNRTGPENFRIEESDQETAAGFEEKILLLKRLLDKGLITQEEYDKKKTALLENL